MMMKNIKQLVIAAMFCSLCLLMTLVIQIPSPMNGYVHLGDCIVLLSGFLLPSLNGAFAAGIGSALADVFSGYTHYALATFIIKFLMSITAHGIYHALQEKTKNTLSLLLSSVIATCIMVCGYFFFDAVLLGNGIAAAASIPGNLVQGLFAIITSVSITIILQKHNVLSLLNK